MKTVKKAINLFLGVAKVKYYTFTSIRFLISSSIYVVFIGVEYRISNVTQTMSRAVFFSEITVHYFFGVIFGFLLLLLLLIR